MRKTVKLLSKENRNLLWLLMEFPIHRYLIANTAGREDGYEKATQHLKLSKIFVASKTGVNDVDEADWDLTKRIHNATDALTSYLDTVIGFPIKEVPDDYSHFKHKFFDKFLELAEEEWDKIRVDTLSD